ncbi:MAG TPA: peptidoglycan-associated lipoprotein Pal [Desulfuromonadales bacterium]|nr:peptidoglycan-associated lipoprotein Pal [Desulfuromonadales bacterium]
MNKSTMTLLAAAACLLTANACAKKPVAPVTEIAPPAPVVQPRVADSDKAPMPAPARLNAEPVSEAAAPVASLLKLEKLFFEFDAYTLTPEAQAILTRNAEWLRQNPAARLSIEGHCDERGSDEYNLALGQRRAEAVKDYLVSLGVAAERLNSISYGEERPAAAGSDESAWSQNRRAEFL